MAAKLKALQQWCKMQCDGYRDVNIVNMTSSWKSGLAFCAIIHRYRPDLIDYDSLSKENVFQNNKLAFDVAQQLGIPALLDPEDMVVMTVPDKLCIITYVSQYYNYFRSHSPATSMKRRLPEDTSSSTAAKKTIIEKPASNDSPANKILEENKSQSNISASSKRHTLEDTCNICQSKVFLMERQIEGNKLYHRHCLRNMQKEQSSALRSSQKLDDQQQRGLDQCCEVQNKSMEYEEYHSDAASGGTDCGNDNQFSASRLDTVVSSGSKGTAVAEVTAGATYCMQVTSSAIVISSAGVTSVNKSVAGVTVVTSAIGVSPISSVALSAILHPKAGVTSSAVVTSSSGSYSSYAEGITYISDTSTSEPTKPVDSAEGKTQLVVTSADHNLQTMVSQSVPVSSSQPTKIPPSTSSLPSKTSTPSESAAAQSVQVPSRPKLPPTIIPQQSGASASASSSTIVPEKPPRSSFIAETPHVEPSVGPNNSLAETSTPSLSQSLSRYKVVSFASHKLQKPDHNTPAGGVGDPSSSVQITTTSLRPQSTSAQISGSCTVLAPKSRPAPNPPDQPVSTSTNLPVSGSVSPSVPVTTLRSILTSKKHPAPCLSNHSLSPSTTQSLSIPVPASAGPSVSTSETLSDSTSTTLSLTASRSFAPIPSVSTSESLPDSTSTTHSLAASRSFAPIPSVSTSETLSDSTSTTLSLTASSSFAPIPSVSTSESLPDSTSTTLSLTASRSFAPILSVSTSETLPDSTSTTPSLTTSSSFAPTPSVRHHVSTAAVHPVSTSASPTVSHSLQTPTDDFGGYSSQNLTPSSQNAETRVSRSSTSHVTPTQSIKLPISSPGRTPPSRPAHPPSGLPGQTPSSSKPSLAPCTFPAQPSSTLTTSTSASSVLHPTKIQPSDKSLALPASPASPRISVVPPTVSGSSEAATVTSTKQTNEQIMSKGTSPNDGQFTGQSVDQSGGQFYVQSGVKHPPIPKRPPSILVSKEIDENKRLPMKLENSVHQTLVVNPGWKDNQEPIEKKDPVDNVALVNGASVEARSAARKSVRENPFNNPEQLSPVKPKDFHGSTTKDHISTGILKPAVPMRKETPLEIQELPKKSAGDGDTKKDAEKVPVKPSPSPRSTVKVKADAPPPPTTQSGSTCWYVGLEREDPQNGIGSAVPKSPAIPGNTLVQNDSEPRKMEGSLDQQKAISLPVPLPRSRSGKGNPECLSSASPTGPPQLSSPERNSAVQPSTSVKSPLTPADGTTSPGLMRAPPPRPTPPRAESIQQARKKITPDTTFTFENQSFNFGPTSGSKKLLDGRELHMRSSTVASNHNQPVVKRKVNAEDRLSPGYIKEQLRLLDDQLKKLEEEGRILENKIRSGTDESMEDDDKNDLMSQWFEMVNHKNDLVRQESELIYRCKQQELEDKHEEVEFELRCLMNKPDRLKTATEKKREEVLLQKLLQTVTQRNNIVESMEEDRIRYLKEDEEIKQMLTTSRLM